MLGATTCSRISCWARDLPSTVGKQCLVSSSSAAGFFLIFFSHLEFAHRLGERVVAHRSRNREYSQRFVGSFLSLALPKDQALRCLQRSHCACPPHGNRALVSGLSLLELWSLVARFAIDRRGTVSGFLIWCCRVFFNFFFSSRVCSSLGETCSCSSLAESRVQSKVCGFVSELGIIERSSTTLSIAFSLCLLSSWKPSIWRTNSTSTACIPTSFFTGHASSFSSYANESTSSPPS